MILLPHAIITESTWLNLLMMAASTAIITLIILFLSWWIEKPLKKTHQIWDDTLIDAFRLPLITALWLFTACSVIQSLQTALNITLINHLSQIHLISVLFCAIWFFWRYLQALEERLLKIYHPSKMNILIIGKWVRVSLIMLMLIMSLQIFGVPLSGLLTFSGAGALIIGFAGKEMISNYLAGIMIYTERLFSVGDFISSPDREITGTVHTIGWRQTCITTNDHQALYVPNSVFSSIILKNLTRQGNRHILKTFYIPEGYLNQVKTLLPKVQQWLTTNPLLDHEQTQYFHLVGYDTQGLQLELRCYLNTTDYQNFLHIQEKILLDVFTMIHETEMPLTSSNQLTATFTPQETSWKP